MKNPICISKYNNSFLILAYCEGRYDLYEYSVQEGTYSIFEEDAIPEYCISFVLFSDYLAYSLACGETQIIDRRTNSIMDVFDYTILKNSDLQVADTNIVALDHMDGKMYYILMETND